MLVSTKYQHTMLKSVKNYIHKCNRLSFQNIADKDQILQKKNSMKLLKQLYKSGNEVKRKAKEMVFLASQELKNGFKSCFHLPLQSYDALEKMFYFTPSSVL